MDDTEEKTSFQMDLKGLGSQRSPNVANLKIQINNSIMDELKNKEQKNMKKAEFKQKLQMHQTSY